MTKRIYTDYNTANTCSSEKVDKFIDEYEELCKKHNLVFVHEWGSPNVFIGPHDKHKDQLIDRELYPWLITSDTFG